MKIKALISFTGKVIMRPSEERTVTDETGQDLIQAGLAIRLDDPEEVRVDDPEEVKVDDPEEVKVEKKPIKKKAAAKEA